MAGRQNHIEISVIYRILTIRKFKMNKLIDVIDSNYNSNIWANINQVNLPNQNVPDSWDNITSPIVVSNNQMEETIENFSDEPAP